MENLTDTGATLKKVADTVLDKPLRLTVYITATGRLHKFLQSKGILPKQKVFELTGVKVSTAIKISRILLTVDTSFFDREKLLLSNYQAIDKYAEKLAECIALTIYNKKGEVPRYLIDFVLDNFTTAEMLRVVEIVRGQMDVSSFMSSIILIQGVNILANPRASVTNAGNEKVSLKAGEIIAPGELSVAL